MSEIISGFKVIRLETVDSTNNYLKRHAAEFRDKSAVIANAQTGGKGRLGRSFFSPEGGLYLSAMIKNVSLDAAEMLTPAVAVAVARALEKCGSEEARIKWVNDVYLRGRKVCGILVESKPEADRLSYAIIGIGVNIFEPEGGFPEDIKARAGAVFADQQPGIREEIFREILANLCGIEEAARTGSFLEEYRRRSNVIGRRVEIIEGERVTEAVAVGIDERCRLIVRTDEGERRLFAGEVSVRM